VPVGQHVRVIVRHHHLAHVARANLGASDDEGDVFPLSGHLFQFECDVAGFECPRVR